MMRQTSCRGQSMRAEQERWKFPLTTFVNPLPLARPPALAPTYFRATLMLIQFLNPLRSCSTVFFFKLRSRSPIFAPAPLHFPLPLRSHAL